MAKRLQVRCLDEIDEKQVDELGKKTEGRKAGPKRVLRLLHKKVWRIFCT